MVGAPGAPKQLQLWRVELEVVDSEHVGLKTKYHKRLYAILRNVNGNCYGACTDRRRRRPTKLTSLSGPCRGGYPVGDADHETASWKFPKHAYTDLGTAPHFKLACQPTVRLPAHGPERGVRQL